MRICFQVDRAGADKQGKTMLDQLELIRLLA